MTRAEQRPETVLVPIDGSPVSHKALRHALRQFSEASITVLHVVDLFEPETGSGVDSAYEPLIGSEEWYGRAEERSEELLEGTRALAEEHDQNVSTVSEIGTPERVIVDFADGESIDHIALGTHGRADEERPLYGSTAETVARRAPVPVTIVR